MRVSNRADYGVRALFELAGRYGQGLVQSRDIAARQAIPEAYLHQVLGALGRAGMIRSTRGPQGGHELIRPPSQITVWDILQVLDGADRRSHPHPNGIGQHDVVHAVWHELQIRQEAYLQSITLETLLERARSHNPGGVYTI
ncbi:MAG: Rrf2 family transcriptional regulator [Thermomicrobiales bacterium]|nr:Rrf2 family transcriptional regulator [Thermomicrobiales bacterium]